MPLSIASENVMVGLPHGFEFALDSAWFIKPEHLIRNRSVQLPSNFGSGVRLVTFSMPWSGMRHTGLH